MHTENEEGFSNNIEYWLSCIGYSVGYGNIWRFPYLLFTNGGGAFLIPYIVALFVISIPNFIIETAYGQVVRYKYAEIWSRIDVRLKGITYGYGLSLCYINLYYITLMAWTFSYLFYSFDTPLPWRNEVYINALNEGTIANMTEEAKEQFWSANFFDEILLKRSESIS